ncbi:MAG: leucine-rich repeat protein [Lachnospiraceae bacterium]
MSLESEKNRRNQNTGNGKKKRRLSAKGKKLIRRAVAGVLFMSAVIVAAIPEDRSGSVSAATSVTDLNEQLDYDGDSGLARNGDFSLGADVDNILANTAGATEYTSYEIRTINNRPTLVWKYKYFIPVGGVAGSSTGVISGYNDSYSVETLNLSGSIYTGFDITLTSDYDNWWASNASNSFSITDISATTNSNIERIARYFSDNTTFTSWRSRFEVALAAYHEANPGQDPSSLEDLNMGTDTLNLVAGDMSAEMQRIYYCDNNNLGGYTLVEVQNYAQNSVYLKSYNTATNTGVSDVIPSDSIIYIAKLNNASDITSAGTNYDENGYKYLYEQAIGAIGNEAFKDCTLVNNLILGDVVYIGDSAFENSFIKTVQFDSINYIGNRVFKDCLQLHTLRLIPQTRVIGKEAFYGCRQLTSVSIPSNTTQIGFGAFAECTLLSNVSFSENLGCNVGEYAFYNCPNISGVTFPDSFSFSFGKAAFAVEPGTIDRNLTSFTFPENLSQYDSYTDNGFTAYTLYDDEQNSYNGVLGDYLFANRSSLETVEWAKNFGTTQSERIPMNTFAGCRGLGCLQFDANENSYALYDSNLFEDVENHNLYVFGPQLKATPDVNGNIANPRYSTWHAFSKELDYVPYVYNDGIRDHYEVGIGDYRYELEISSNGQDASLISCDFIHSPAPIDELIIPSEVAEYKVTEMVDGCLDSIKDYVKALVVPDGSISSIDSQVFQGADLLEHVFMGDSVSSIGTEAFAECPNLKDVVFGENIENVGARAFADCPLLENVYWTSPSSASTLQVIGSDAFYTTSDKLYFHGVMENGYAPFDYAMGNNQVNSDSVRIAYKTLEPAVYTAIMDDASGQVLLIDYPMFADLPADIQTKFNNGTPLNNEEQALLDATIYLNLPQAIESIDIKSFLDISATNVNRKDWLYVDDISPVTSGALTKREAFGDDNASIGGTAIASLTDSGYSAGLFSGYFVDSFPLSVVGEMDKESDTKGNDWILSISMPGVVSIPDMAFDSCERLQSVIISDDCTQIGESAFQGCMSLTTIGTNNNPNYRFDNGILYQNKADGTLEINTCIPARGTNRNSSEIWLNTQNDPLLSNVSSMKEGAFASCEYITKVDLSDTSISTIPRKAFDGCITLSEIILPNTVRNISTGAFDNGASSLDLTVPCDSQISDTAFDPDAMVTIWTYPDCTITAGYQASNNDEVYIRYLNSAYTITFINDDLSVFERIEVDAGRNGYYPMTDPTPNLPTNAGKIFSYWSFDNPNNIVNVTENRQAIAVYVDPSPSPGAGSGASALPSGASPAASSSAGASSSASAKASSSAGTNNGSNTSASSSATPNGTAASYNVTVENGAGTGSYQPGSVVTITAYAAADGKEFDMWTTSNADIGFSDRNAVSTTFIMPTHDVKVTATYKTQGSSSAAGGSNSGNNGTASGNNTSGNKNNGGGTDVTVTTGAIDNNNKNLVSASVSGSTDNFVIKITDSAQASAEVESALKAAYGNDLSNIKYVAFDISLYDETGTNKIENYDGLAVTITIPIPDDLVSYAGNNRVGAVINGALDTKATKFTTIDGVPCMTFTATHFSPYTVYVNTSTLVEGVTDETPKTGDGIAPKWFLATGLLCGSVVLFLWKDKKKTNAAIVK